MRLCLDDFGAGSLGVGALSSHPFGAVKIARARDVSTGATAERPAARRTCSASSRPRRHAWRRESRPIRSSRPMQTLGFDAAPGIPVRRARPADEIGRWLRPRSEIAFPHVRRHLDRPRRARERRPTRPTWRARGGRSAARGRAVVGRADRGLPAPHRRAQRRLAHVSTARRTRSTPGCGSIPSCAREHAARADAAPRPRRRRHAAPVRHPDRRQGPLRRERPAAHRLQPRSRRGRARHRPTRRPGRPCATRAWCCSATPTRTSSPPAAPPTRSATRSRLDAIAGRLERRQRRGAGRANDARRARERHVRLAAHPVRVLRNVRDQAHARTDLARRDPAAGPLARPPGPDGAHGGRLRRAAARPWPTAPRRSRR